MRFLAAILLGFFALALKAQTSFAPIVIDNQTAQEHLQEHPNLGIEPIAKMAHVVGDVMVQVKIDPTGRVVGAVVLSGPAMLFGTATDSVREWTFTRFMKDGQPVFATTVVKVSYSDRTPIPKHSYAHGLESYSHAQTECVMSRRRGAKPANTAKACGKFSKAADALTPGQFLWEQREAYIDASDAYLHNNEPDQALSEAEKAVALVKSGDDDSHSIALAYGARALAEAQKHNLNAADTDLAISEEAERGAIATVQSETMKKTYIDVLKAVLKTHAQVLNALNNVAEAKIKSDEAAKL